MDEYISQALDEGRIRPLSGFLWAERLQTEEVESVEGLGNVRVSGKTDSGLVLIDMNDSETEMIDSFLFVVRVLGNDPNDWHFRYFERERSWNASWGSQRIGVGTVIAVRPVSGVGQSKTSHFRQFRWDEVVAVGRPLDEDAYPDMLPAPGWVLLQMDADEEQTTGSGLVLGGAINKRLYDGRMDWGTVVALPHGLEDEYSVTLGDRVGTPYHRGAGATEWLDFDGGLRAVPYDDLLLVEE